MNEAVFAVDLGGTNMRLAAVTAEGDILNNVRRPTPRGVTPDLLLSNIKEMSDECLTGLDKGIVPLALGLGVPANVTAGGILRHFPNIPTLEGLDVGAELASATGMPVVPENDATAACIGEAWLGVSKGCQNSIFITLGTGVGGGLIMDGKPLRGPDGGAGKIGHICVEPDGHPCGCGSNGCIEQYASATALVRMAQEAGKTVKNSFELYKSFHAGDAVSASVFERMGRYLGITLGGLVNALNPDMIVVGGGVAAGIDAFIEPFEREMKYRAFKEPAERARIVASELGDNAGILGGAKLALDRVGRVTLAPKQ